MASRGIVDHTIDPDSLLHDDVLCFDHHADLTDNHLRQSLSHRSRSWTCLVTELSFCSIRSKTELEILQKAPMTTVKT